MTPADIERMAREAGASTSRRTIWPPTFEREIDFSPASLARFAALVQAAERERILSTQASGLAEMIRAQERERCAILCETTASQHYASARIAADYLPVQFRAAAEALTNAAAAIRGG